MFLSFWFEKFIKYFFYLSFFYSEKSLFKLNYVPFSSNVWAWGRFFSLPLFILFNKVNVGVFCSLILIDFLNWDPLQIMNQQSNSEQSLQRWSKSKQNQIYSILDYYVPQYRYSTNNLILEFQALFAEAEKWNVVIRILKVKTTFKYI